MSLNLVVFGLFLDIIGVAILVIVTIFNPWYQRREDLKWWEKRYSWSGWRPIYKNTKTLEWTIKLNRKVIVDWFMPPKHQWSILGFLCVLIGFLLQLKFYLS